MSKSVSPGAESAPRSAARPFPAWLLFASMVLMSVATILLVVFGQ